MSKSDRKRVLVTSGFWQAALNFVQSLGRKGHEIHLLDDRNASHGYSRFCHRRIPTPNEYDTSRYVECMLRELESGGYDALVPISDRSIDLASRHEAEIRRHTAVTLPRAESVRLARDKAATCRFALEHGIPVPTTYFPETLEEVERLARTIRYPCVVKLPRGTASDGVFFPGTAEELVRIFSNRWGTGEQWPFVQEFVAGDIGDFTAVCDHGEILAHFMFRTPIRYLIGGTPPYAFSLVDPALLETARHFVRLLQWHGPIDLDFIRTEGGEHYLLEINPRLSGTVNFAYKLGIDLPQVYLDQVLHGGGASQVEYPDGILYRTVFPAEVIWLKRGRGKHLRHALGLWARPRSTTSIVWDDWPLTYRQVREAIGILRRPEA